MRIFFIATLLPTVILGLAAFWGGLWAYLALLSMTVFVFAMDRLVAVEAQNAPEGAEFPAAIQLLYLLGGVHFVAFGCGIWAGAGDGDLSAGARVAMALTSSVIIGQISHPAAHELIHASGRFARFLGRVIYASMAVGHHASAHLRVHHIHVGSDQDPNSAPMGMGFYRFFLRASVGSFMAGLRAESEMLRRAGRPLWRHPYLLYALLSAGVIALVWSWLGARGVLIWALVAFYAQVQILLADYVQHYGLRRARRADGRLEPVGPQHSWNTPHWYSSAMMVNAPRHSDHHMVPNRPFPALKLVRGEMPILPYPLPFMAGIALIPPLWRRVMDKRVIRWAERSGEAA